MSHEVGDKVWSAWVSTRNIYEIEPMVSSVVVAAVVEERPLFRLYGGGLRERYEFETICETEADAWVHCAQEIAVIRDRVVASVENAIAKAASFRVGEAVPA
jgi:hypothetical protein